MLAMYKKKSIHPLCNVNYYQKTNREERRSQQLFRVKSLNYANGKESKIKSTINYTLNTDCKANENFYCVVIPSISHKVSANPRIFM